METWRSEAGSGAESRERMWAWTRAARESLAKWTMARPRDLPEEGSVAMRSEVI